MFLRATRRFKDGKSHYYWSLVESVRVGRRVFQRQALYLGELNDSQRMEWQKAVEVRRRQVPADEALSRRPCAEDG